MNSIGKKFRAWLVEQSVSGVPVTSLDDNRFRVNLQTVTAEVNLYPGLENCDTDIAEYRITRLIDNDSIFFLHVLLDDLERAKELFEEMADTLEAEADQHTKHILLCCTSAMTTSLFAAKMGDVAMALSLDYDFTALPITDALRPGGDWAAILLAPQASHMRNKMSQAHPNSVVFEIPGKVFGSYNAAEAVQLLLHALNDIDANVTSQRSLRATRGLANDRRILIITLFYLRDYCRLGFRLFDHGNVTDEGTVRKTKLDFRDIEDLVETLPARGIPLEGLDAIGIALPGVAYRGTASLSGIPGGEPYDLRGHIEARFEVKAYVDNNCNAAAVGCYVSQNKYENLMFYRHAFGHVAGGLGTIIDGKLLKGRGNIAGETKYYEHLYHYDQGVADANWSEEGLLQIAANICATSIALTSPEAIYLAVDTVDDMDELRAELEKTLPPEYIPPLFYVDDYIERVYLGEMAISLQKLHDPSYRSLGIVS